MKKPILPVAIAAVAVMMTAAAKSDDPVIMKINGKDIHKSEFEYLYNKNNAQQETPQSIDEYVDLFVNYKLKVADAEAAGIDTTATFRREFEGYCNELAAPYMKDTLVYEQLVQEAYDRMQRSVDISQIMLPIGNTIDEREANKALLDSIRTAIINGADFGEMAMKYSSDQSKATNKGHYGFISANIYPYPFEDAAFSTPVGQISEVVEDAPYGYHIIRVEAEKPNPGRVHARHILKLTRGLSEEEAAVKKQQIDSIYTLLKNGADFAKLAAAESEDQGSGRKGGDVGIFGPGRMVREFETTAFALPDSAISEPIQTAYGYHIVQTLEHLGVESKEEARKNIEARIKGDNRASMPEKVKLNELKKQYRSVVKPEGLVKVKELIAAAPTDSAAFADLDVSDIVVASVAENNIPASDVVATIARNTRFTTPDVYTSFSNALNNYIDDATKEYYKADLAENNPDYRNLVNEYRDGILLFEISNRNVWDKSNKDQEGLEAYFKAHRDNYKWDAPKYKGYVIFATSDSIATAAEAYLKANKVDNDSLSSVMRKEFGRNIKIEKVVAGQGENAILDNVAFGGEKPGPVGRWTSWFAYDGRIISAPEEASDIKGVVTADYQQQLEKDWVTALHKKYPVKLIKKEIKKLH
ncbi:MAG: peptidyl-prolyl cis-trans isomerase [Lachnoclostridium sp.]|nr:peptidyl-prolyl cis-trans isomerase [Lachnoclostridium sp.]